MKLRCDNCGKTFGNEGELEHRLPDIAGLGSRLDPGGIVPSGTCPACGSLVYLTAEARGAVTNGGATATVPPDGRAEEFCVEWTIDLSAESSQQAAEKALRIQRKADSIATVFDVTCSATGIRRTVDLSEESHRSEASGCRVCLARPVPDWVDEFAAGAAEELADDGLTEAEALAIASEAADIIREHEARKTGKEVS